MKKVLVAFMAVFICSLSAWGQTSVATIGRAVTQCNDFAFAKNLLTGDGLIYDETKSNKSFARFYKPAQYADKALFVEVYKSREDNKIEKCVVTFYNVNYLSDLRKIGYKYCNPEELSIEPFQELYESDKYAMGLNRNKKGWLIATFFRYDQEVEFEHLNGSSSQNKEDNDKQESKIDLNDVFSSGADDPTDYNYTELCEDELKYLDSLGVYWSDKLECWATKDIRLIENIRKQKEITQSDNTIYSIVENQPEFLGGNEALLKYIRDNLKYPKNARKNEIQGKVIVKFVVLEDGSISEPKITQGVEESLNAEAIRVVSSMPKWKPGTINGEPVKVKYSIPIFFRLR